MDKETKKVIVDLGDPAISLITAKSMLHAIISKFGGVDALAQRILDDMDGLSGAAKVQIYKALLSGLLKIDEAEVKTGDILDEQTDTLMQRMGLALDKLVENPSLIDKVLSNSNGDN